MDGFVINDFVKYVMEFYGKGGIYDFGAKEEDIYDRHQPGTWRRRCCRVDHGDGSGHLQAPGSYIANVS